jgi:uncharacterized membrane protein YbhN (UPF0104 family)
MASFVLKFGHVIAGLVACVACLVATGTGIGWAIDSHKKPVNESKVKGEKISFITFTIIFGVASIIGFFIKVISDKLNPLKAMGGG